MCLFFLLTSPSWGFPGFTRVRLHTFVSASFRLGFPQPLIFSQSFSGLLSPTTTAIVVYLYDSLGEAPLYQVTLDHSTKVKSDLVHSGFVPNSEKSVWVPNLVIDWLGFTIDFLQGLLFIPGKKIKQNIIWLYSAVVY